MKKSLIALALASAISAPAFAATSNVDVYGLLNVAINHVNSGTTGLDKSNSLTSGGSRIGFKGSEDLGGGLAAIWQLETGFDATGGTSANALNLRDTFVGLSGGFGTVIGGKHDTPMKMLGRSIDNFGDTMGDSRNILGADALSGGTNFDLGAPNVVAYISPSFNGLTMIGAYVTDHLVTGPAASCAPGLDCNKNDAWSASAGYNNGPLMLGLGYEKHNVDTISRRMWRAVGSYDIAGFKLGAEYENGSADVGLKTADRNAWGLFGNYAMGNVTLKANYLKVDAYNTSVNTGAKQYTVGADYALSKRTTAYALYAKIKNDTGARFDLGNAPGISNSTLTTAGDDPSVFGLGLKHSF